MIEFFKQLGPSIAKLDGNLIFELLCYGLMALVLIKLGPHIIKAIVIDRENRRRHRKQMSELEKRIDRRSARSKRQKKVK